MNFCLFFACALACAQRLPNMSAPEYIDAFNSIYSYDLRVAKYNLMSQSSFGFFRGSNHLWLMDTLSSSSRDRFGSAKTILQGDAHVYNVGSYDSSRGNESVVRGDIVYNLNDYDESFYGDAQIDVWRVCVSLILTIRLNGIVDPLRERQITSRYARTYAESIVALDQNLGPAPPVVRDLSTSDGKLFLFLLGLRSRDRSQMLDLYIKKNGFDTSKRTLSTPSLKEADAIKEQLDLINVKVAPELCRDVPTCSRFLTVKSVARREDTGIGSYGVKRFFVLIEGASDKNKDDYILDVKEQPWPTAYSFLNSSDKAQFLKFYNETSNASRVVNAEAMMSNSIAKILGSIEIEGKPYSVRDRSPWKNTFPALLQDAGLSDNDFPVAEKENWALGSKNDTEDDLEKMIDQWAQVMAVAHYQGGKNANLNFSRDFRLLLTSGSDTSAGVKAFSELAKTYAEAYATQVEADYRAFRSWGSCVSNACIWPPVPQTPGSPTNYVLILIGAGVGLVLVAVIVWWYCTRVRTMKQHRALNGQSTGDTDDEPVWSGQVTASAKPRAIPKLLEVNKIDAAEIDEYSKLDEFEGHNGRSWK